MLVSERYTIDEETLQEKADGSDYWANCQKFYKEKKDDDIGDLSPKQLSWLEKIEQGLHDAEGYEKY